MTDLRRAMSEDDLLSSVIDLARVFGILVHHSRPARMKDGRWVTPISGDKGLPDLVLVGTRGVLFRELKAQKGRTSREQGEWLDRLLKARANAAVWRPSDWPERIRTELEAIR